MTQTTLSGDTLIDVAIRRIREHEPPEGYWLAFSGGKDSIVCYRLAEMAGVKFTAHYSVTTIDPPKVTRFIREEYPQVIRDYPRYKGERTNFYELVARKGLPNRMVRWCCMVFKERQGGKGATVILGVRSAESAKRAGRPVFYEREGKYLLNPILEWSDNDVWDFIHSQKLKYPSVYDSGSRRVGCIMCPLACRASRVKHYEEYPQHVRAIERAVDRLLEGKRREEKETSLLKWGRNGHEIVYHWVHDSPIESAKGACMQHLIEEAEQ